MDRTCSCIIRRSETSGHASLDEGQRVEFLVGQGKKGPCATKVVPL